MKIFTCCAILFALSPPQPYTPPTPISNLLPYHEGNVEIDSEIDPYQQLNADNPIKGSIFITQENNEAIVPESFLIGDSPLKATFVSSHTLSPQNTTRITIYTFTLDAMSEGMHHLPPISVIVGDKRYAAPMLSIEVNPSQ